MATPSDPTAAVLDASAAVAVCAPEPGREAVVAAYLADAGAAGLTLHAPGVIVAESLHVFCKKLARGELDAASHAAAVAALVRLMITVLPPPGGESSLVAAAARLNAGYACNKSSDSLYLALAERLAASGEVVEVATFDDDQARRAGRLTGVAGRRLPEA